MFNQLKTVRTVLLAVVNPEPVIIDWGLLYSFFICSFFLFAAVAAAVL